MAIRKVLIVGATSIFSLETSYAAAAKELGYSVFRFDPAREILKYTKLGKIGRFLFGLFNVEVWSRKMNRELVLKFKEETPDVVILVGGSKIMYGALTTMKAIYPKCKWVWIWPDTPLNLNDNILSYSRLLDVSASYSKATIKSLQLLGFNNVNWLPLAGDPFLHSSELNVRNIFKCDISFVGMWRPERERVMKDICKHFSHLKIEIYGLEWQSNCRDKEIMKRWKGSGFFAKEMADHFNTCRINVNIIDDTNYPAANMRFFEIPTAGGLQLSSSCPEFEDEFLDKEHILYFKNSNELREKITWILERQETADKIRKSAQVKIKNFHNYTARLAEIMSLLSLTNKELQ